MKTIKFIIFTIFLTGCIHNPTKPNGEDKSSSNQLPKLENVKMAKELPIFTRQINEIELSDSFNDVDPTYVIGSLVNKKTGEVRSFENFLKQSSKINSVAVAEVYFRNFIEESVAVSAKWMDFVGTQIKNGDKAEVSITKISKVNVLAEAVDKASLKKFTSDIPKDEREDWAVIIGYSSYLLQASLFKDSAVEGKTSGYGAQIDGKWYSKYEDTSAYQRIVAVWAPLPFIFEVAGSKSPEIRNESLESITQKAIDSGALNANKIESITNLQENTE